MSIYVSFDLYKDKPIVAAFSTKLGGVSKGDCESMNLSFNRNDNPDDVLKNHEIFAKAVGYDVKNCVLSDQVHSTNIRRVTHEDCGKGIFKASDIVNTDGLICNEKDVVLMTFYADCVPLYFYDEAHHAIGLSHSGWRGTVGKMAIKTIDMMKQEYGSNTDDIIGVIGPSICQDCYEISEDVAQQFKTTYTNEQSNNLLKINNNGKYQLNLHQANVYNMLGGGLKKENIYVTDICTCCNPKLLFSHRASNGQRGGLCGFLEII